MPPPLLLAGDCLLDPPAQALSLPSELPGRGALYSLDQQCQQIFGKDFQHCPNTTEEDVCAQLWCRTSSGEPLCHTKNGSLPWADGTPCMAGGLCWDGACLPQDALQPQVLQDSGWRGGIAPLCICVFSYVYTFTTCCPMPKHRQPPKPAPKALLPSTVLYGMGHPFGWFGSAVSVLSLPAPHPPRPLRWQGSTRSERSLALCSTSTLFLLNPKHSITPITAKKINSLQPKPGQSS